MLKKVQSLTSKVQSIKSHGRYMRQRLGLAQVIIENPNILILDEPTNALDKDGVANIREYLKELKKERKTILIASHSTKDINTLCDTVHEMDKGNISIIR